MRFSWILSRYIFLRSLTGFAMIFAALSVLFFIFDLAEMMRQVSSQDKVSFALVLEMTLLRLPYLTEKLLPFAVLFGGLWTFSRLARSHELVVIRSAGVSVWQFLTPAVLSTVFISAVLLLVYNPISAAFMKRVESLQSRLSQNQNLMLISNSGLWVRQPDENKGYSMLHGDHLDEADRILMNVLVLRFDQHDKFYSRIDADGAQLKDGFWLLHDAYESTQGKASVKKPAIKIPTDLTLTKLQDSFSSPDTLSFWALPKFIKTLQKSGFSASRHRLHWHSQLATPIFLASMILLAASFALRPPRQGRNGRLIITGIGIGFLVYFFNNLIHAYGLSGQLPLVLAAWGPPMIVLFLGTTALLHLEDS